MPQTIPEAEASNDKRVERCAADGDGKQEGDRLFMDHLHGSFPLFCCGSGPGEAEGERVRRPGLRIMWGEARNFKALRRTKIFHDRERKLQATRRTGAAGQGTRGAGDAATNIRGELMAASRVLLARPLRRGAWPIRAAKGGAGRLCQVGQAGRRAVFGLVLPGNDPAWGKPGRREGAGARCVADIWCPVDPNSNAKTLKVVA